MNATATAPTVHVVTKRDRYDTRRCARCKQAVGELDVIVADDRAVTHYDCLPQRSRATLPAPVADAARCWYAECPLASARANLCTAHATILYGAEKKPPRTR